MDGTSHSMSSQSGFEGLGGRAHDFEKTDGAYCSGGPRLRGEMQPLRSGLPVRPRSVAILKMGEMKAGTSGLGGDREVTALPGWGRCGGRRGWLRDAAEEEGTVTGSELVSLQTSFKSHQESPKCRICAVPPGSWVGGSALCTPCPVGLARASPPLLPPTDRGRLRAQTCPDWLSLSPNSVWLGPGCFRHPLALLLQQGLHHGPK